ncbi:MAG: shikimate dehydrogenase [Gammaproteobacteria bacterium]|nr:shikimate dehydrogenase [Gammaproteobacteria bacterium]MDH5735344.1 shikimate dehydrogenase [Gammaproteobacteria bacterium]
MNQKHTDRYAVIGNPVAHSKSPLIHSEFARQTEQDIIYTAEQVEPGQVAEFIKKFQSENGKGLNVTVPFKEDAFKLASHLSNRARRAGAVNTLLLNDPEHYYGDTTDGIGLCNDLIQNHNITLKDKTILILGAGGAVRGVLELLLNNKPAQLVIANRTVEKAVQLASDFSDLGNITASSFENLAGQKFDLIINGTSASLSGDLPPLPDNLLNKHATIYDMMYGAKPTVFMEWGQQQGAEQCFDGLGMLVEQAAESFFIWRKIRPVTADVITKVRSILTP